MGMIMDVIHSLGDMSKLGKLTNSIQTEMDALDKEGKLPAELKTAYEKLKSGTSAAGSNVEASVEPLKEFVTELEKYESLFPDSVKNIVAKFEEVTKDLEGIAEDIDTKTGNK